MLSVVVLLLLPCATFGLADAKDSQAEAALKFPELAKAGSKFNQAFLAKFQAAKVSNDPILSRNDWPMAIASAVATDLGAAPVADPEVEAARAKAFQAGSTFFIWRKEKNPVKGENGPMGGKLQFDLSFALNSAKTWEPYQILILYQNAVNGRVMQNITTIKMGIKPGEMTGRLPISLSLTPGANPAAMPRTTGKGVMSISLIKDSDSMKRSKAPPISNILTVPMTFD